MGQLSPPPSTLPNLQPPSMFDIPLNDPLNGLIQNHLASAFGGNTRLPYNDLDVVNDSWEDTAIAYAVMEQCAFLKLPKESKRLLLADKKDVDAIMKLWCYRLLSLININLCQLASAELDKLGDLFRSELHYDAYPELFPERRGAMVPFTLQVIWARLPSYLGDNTTTIDRLYFLLARCNQASLAEADKEHFWLERIKQLSILVVNYLVKMEDFALAIEILDCLVTAAGLDPTVQHILFRLHLHCGNLPCAREAFQGLYKSLSNETRPLFGPVLKIDESLLHMAEGNWRSAQEVLTQHLNNYPADHLASNNLAVCCLYLCDLPKAVETLQTITQSVPSGSFYKENTPSLLATVTNNLATLYELATQHHLDRKRALLEQLHSHIGDGFDIASFKLP